MENKKAFYGPLGGTISAVNELRDKATAALVSMPVVSAILRTTGQIRAMPAPISLQLMAYGISGAMLTLTLVAFKAVSTAQDISGLSGGRFG